MMFEGISGSSTSSSHHASYQNELPSTPLKPEELGKNTILSQYDSIDELIKGDVMVPLKRQRKSSDEDVYVEETIIFTYDPLSEKQDKNQSPQKRPQTKSASSLSQLNHNPKALKENHLLRVEVFNEEEEDVEQDQKWLQFMMNGEYPDDEIDKLIETFKMSGFQGRQTILNGEIIDNDIRLSENIRNAIDEIRQVQKPSNQRSSEIEKRKFLVRYIDTAELLGVSLAVEYLLPCLYELVSYLFYHHILQFKQDEGNAEKGFIKQIFSKMESLISLLSSVLILLLILRIVQSQITVGYNGIRDYVMPMIYDYFQTDRVDESLRQEIQNDVIDLLVRVTKIMTTEDRAEKVLPIIIENINDSDEEKRILGLDLMDRLADLLGKDICQNYLMQQIVSLQDDPIYRVRKETCMKMINIAKILGKDVFLKILFPVYKNLSQDQIWGVRRAAVEVLPQISELCPVEVKNGVLIELFKRFASDSSKWVKMATFQFLGPFIASYQGIEPNPILVDYYINMCEQNKGNQPDNEIPFHCAFNFPAVLLTLGPKMWPKIKPVHETLVKDPRWKVRRSLSFSLHEIAKILGPEITENELMPVLSHFLQDINEVREGVLTNLPKFIKVLTPEQREKYVGSISQAQVETSDWRKRVILAHHIKAYAKLFSPETVNQYYVPIFFQLCQDQVAEVREQAAKSVKNLAVKLREDHELFREFIQRTLLYKQSAKYSLRQTFIYMCEALMECEDIFVQFYLKDLSDLSRDRIINVRVVLSEIMARHYAKSNGGGIISYNHEIQLILRNLKLDVRDVSEPLKEIDVEEDSEQLIEFSLETSSLIIERVLDSIMNSSAATETTVDSQ